MSLEQYQLLLGAIKATQELRTSVANVFDSLSHGIKKPEDSSEPEKDFLATLQKGLSTVNNDLSELEKVSGKLQNTALQLPPNNINMLTLDPIIDKTNLHSHLTATYKWAKRLNEHATTSMQLLTQNNLRRTYPVPLSAKRSRRAVYTNHNASPNLVEQLIRNLWQNKEVSKHMSFEILRTKDAVRSMQGQPMTQITTGSQTVVQVTLGYTLKALIVFRGAFLEWVTCVGLKEDLLQEDGHTPNIWAKSRYKVFQKVSENMIAATLQYYHPLNPERMLPLFFTMWLMSYRNLFSAPCIKCGKLLQDNLPPTWRDPRFGQPYHESCKL